MFRSFFLNRRWLLWSVLGTLFIIGVTYFRVQLDVQINEWFGGFYDTIQKALATPGAVTFPEILGYLWTFAGIAGVAIVAAVILEFFLRHYVFRWRTAMNEYYTAHWQDVRHIEGASQRIQEDTMRFATHHGDARHRAAAVADDPVRLPADAVGDVGQAHGAALDRGGPAFAGVGGAGLVAVRHRPAGGGRHQAAGPGIQQPARGGGLPQGAGLRRGVRGPGEAADAEGTLPACAGQLLHALQALPLLRHRQVELPAVRRADPLHRHGTDHRGGRDHAGGDAAGDAGLRPGGSLLPVPGQQLGHDRGTAQHLQAPERLRDPVEGAQRRQRG